MFKGRKMTSLWGAGKPWIKVAGVLGVGMLPCPDCGAPMIFHFWPVALVLAMVNFVRGRRAKAGMPNQAEEPDAAGDGCLAGEAGDGEKR